MVLKFFTENKLFYFSKRELRAGTARNVVKGSPVQSLVMKHRSKSTLETLEQLLISSKVNIKHNRTTSWSSFLTQLSELNIFWMIVSTLLLSLSTLHYCVLLCTGMQCSASKRISKVAQRIRAKLSPDLFLATSEQLPVSLYELNISLYYKAIYKTITTFIFDRALTTLTL